MDLVRLAIVYDTTQAAANLRQLDSLTAALQANTNALTQRTRTMGQSMSVAGGSVRGVEGALRSLAIQATGVSGPVGKLSTALVSLGTTGNVVIGVLAGVAAGYFLLFKRAKEAREENEKLAKSFADVAGGGAAFNFISAQLQLTAAQQQLDDMIARRARIDQAAGGGKGVARLLLGVRDQDITDQQTKVATLANLVGGYRDAWRDAHQKIIDGVNDVDDALKKSLDENAARISMIFRGMTGQIRAMIDQFHTVTTIVGNISVGPGGFGVSMVGSKPGGTDITKVLSMNDAIDRLVEQFKWAGMSFGDIGNASKTLADDLTMAGKSALDFVGFLAQAVGVLFPGNPELSGLIMGIGSVIQGASASSGAMSKGAKGFEGIRAAPVSSATTVNFNVQAMDAQGVAQFFNRNAPVIAAEVTRQADRSRSIRRRFWRG